MMMAPPRSNSGTASHNDDELCPALWSTLPRELLERTLAFLPFPHLFRLRTVCRRWNALPHCAYFRHVAPNHWGACLPVLFCKDTTLDAADDDDSGWNSDSWSAFDTSSHSWLRLPPLTCLEPRHPKYLVVGSGGLLCIGDFDGTENLIVCNPVTRSFRELPPTLLQWAEPDLTSMAIATDPRPQTPNPNSNPYKLVLAGNRAFNPEKKGYRTTEVYDSRTKSWSITGDIPPNIELHSQEGALCNNILYCLARNFKFGDWNTIAAYDLASGKWTTIVQNIPHGSRTPHIIGSHGRILAIAEQDEIVALFELNLVTKQWRKVSEMPNEMYAGLGKRVVACTVDGDRICVTGCSANRWFSVMYRSVENVWLQVPAFPVVEGTGKGKAGRECELLLSSSPFRPSLEPV